MNTQSDGKYLLSALLTKIDKNKIPCWLVQQLEKRNSFQINLCFSIVIIEGLTLTFLVHLHNCYV